MWQTEHSFFAVALHQVGSRSYKHKQAIIDSGTSLLLLEDSLFEKWMDELPDGVLMKAQGLDYCVSTLPSLPPLRLVLDRVQLDIPVSLYFIKYNPQKYCFGVAKAERGRSIIGDVVLRGFTVVYDVDNARVGFAKVNESR